METSDTIAAEAYCNHYNIQLSFIQQLEEHGLITVTTIDEQWHIQQEQLPAIERYLHLHYDLDINMAGIEAISHLLSRVTAMQHELTNLRTILAAGAL